MPAFLFGLISIESKGARGADNRSRFTQGHAANALVFQALQLSSEAQARQNADKKPKANSLYTKYCQKCHAENGKGTDARKLFPEIPDFTSEKWQSRRSDAELVTSVLDGKGTSMPQFADKFNRQKATALVTFVRSFAPLQTKPNSKQTDLGKQLQELFEQMEELRKQSRDLSKRPVQR
jgi:mono/diheme cytochrome c family protein